MVIPNGCSDFKIAVESKQKIVEIVRLNKIAFKHPEMLRSCASYLQKLPVRRPLVNSIAVIRDFSDKTDQPENIEEEVKKSGFARAFERHSMPQEQKREEKLPDVPFATLLRNSKLIDVSISRRNSSTLISIVPFLARRSQGQSCDRKNIPHR